MVTAEWADFALHEVRQWLITAVDWTSHATDLLVVHYESLVDDPAPQMERVLHFLRLPVDAGRLRCIQVRRPFSSLYCARHVDLPLKCNPMNPKSYSDGERGRETK